MIQRRIANMQIIHCSAQCVVFFRIISAAQAFFRLLESTYTPNESHRTFFDNNRRVLDLQSY